MNFQLKKMKPIVVVGLSVGLFILHLWVNYITFHYPYMGIGVEATDSNTIIITDFYDGGIGQGLGLRINDEVTLINRLPASQYFTVQQYKDIEQVHRITIIRDQVQLSYTVDIEKNSVTIRYLVTLVAEVICFSIAVYLLLKAKKSLSINYLVAMFLCIGIAFMSAEASSRCNATGKFFLLSTVILTPFFLFHFVSYYFQERGYRITQSKWIYSIYILVLTSALSKLAYYFPLPNESFYRFDRQSVLFFFLLGCLMNLILLVYIYFKRYYEFSTSRLIIKTLLYSFTFSFVPFLLLSIVPDFIGQTIVSYSYAIVFIAAFPIIFTIMSVRHRLFKFERLRNTKLMQIAARITSSIPHSSIAEWTKINHIIGSINSYDDLKYIVLPELCSVLGTKNAAIVTTSSLGTRMISTGLIDELELMDDLNNGRNSNRYACYNMNKGSEQLGQLILIPSLSGNLISSEKLQWLNLILPHLSSALEILQLIEKLSTTLSPLMNETAVAEEQVSVNHTWLKKTVYHLQEQERLRMASELHDTVMQDIYSVKRRLLAMQGMEKTQLNRDLPDLVEYLDIIGLNLRDVGFKLYPHLLSEVGFCTTISNLIESERVHSAFRIHLQLLNHEQYDQLSIDLMLQLFRMTQELMADGKKHSHAEDVYLSYDIIDSEIVLSYADNGVGFDPSSIALGTGLQQLNNRVSSMSGSITMKSTHGEGVAAEIRIPLSEPGVIGT